MGGITADGFQRKQSHVFSPGTAAAPAARKHFSERSRKAIQGQQLASAAYSRRQETEADETAFQYCITNGVDPFAMYHALNVLLSLSGNTGQQGTLAQAFSDHPDTQKRATHIKELAEAAGYTLNSTGSTGGKSGSVSVAKPASGSKPSGKKVSKVKVSTGN